MWTCSKTVSAGVLICWCMLVWPNDDQNTYLAIMKRCSVIVNVYMSECEKYLLLVIFVLFLWMLWNCSSGPNKEMWWLTCNDNTRNSGRRTSFLNTPDDKRLRPKHVEWFCRNIIKLLSGGLNPVPFEYRTSWAQGRSGRRRGKHLAPDGVWTRIVQPLG